MNQGNHLNASIDGNGFIFWSQTGMTIVTVGTATVMGSDQNTVLVAKGHGDVTFVAGDGNNIAYGGNGNDVLVGGDGYNRFYGGNGDDVLIGGSGANDLNGGYGNDTLMFGEWDQIAGGAGADHFVFVTKHMMEAVPSSGSGLLPTAGGPPNFSNMYAEHVFARDLNFWEGDTLDLSMYPEFSRGNMVVVDDTLMVSGPQSVLQIEGVGHQITMAGGIDAAIKAGDLVVYGQYWYPVPEVTLVGSTTTTTVDHSVPVGGKG